MFILLRFVLRAVVPWFRVTGALFIKHCIVGKFVPSASEKIVNSNRSAIKSGEVRVRDTQYLFKYWIMSRVLRSENFCGVVPMLGNQSGEYISTLFRLFGAKIGKRVQWPAEQGILFSQLFEMDLLEIGDDVIIGQSVTFMPTTHLLSHKIILESGVFIGEHSVLLPGAHLHRHCAINSATLIAEKAVLAENSLWIGNDNGSAIPLRVAATTFYEQPRQTNRNGDRYSFTEHSISAHSIHSIHNSVVVRKQNDYTNPQENMLNIQANLLSSMQQGNIITSQYGRAVYLRDANYFVIPSSLMGLYRYAYFLDKYVVCT